MCDRLRGSELFQDLSDVAVREVLASCTEQHYSQDQLIIERGVSPRALYLLTEGEVVVFRDVVGEPAQRLARLGPGSFFGELGLWGEEHQVASVRAVEPTRILAIAWGDLLLLLHRFPALRATLDRVAARRHSINVSTALSLWRQREVRVRLKGPAGLRLGGSQHQVRVENLSLGGICIGGFPAGHGVGDELTFSLLVGPGVLEFVGRITWQREDTVGIAFTRRGPRHDTLIQMAIHYLLGETIAGPVH